MCLGVLDSGIGGLSILSAIRAQLPQVDIVYIADQANLPYGPRSLTEVQQFTEGITRYLLDQGCEAVVIACNTASAAALKYLRQVLPDVPFVGLEPAVRPAAKNTHKNKIGVIATQATFQGELYNSLIERYATDVNVIARAAPELVTLAERGQPWTAADQTLVSNVLQDIREAGADQLVLGCTHFSFLTPLLQTAMGASADIIDPAPAVARQVERVLSERDLLSTEGIGEVLYLTTGDVPRFVDQIENLLGERPEQVGALRWSDGKLAAL
jgi:glutamate racemase